MAKVTEVRLTIAALIYGIEIDLKLLINNFITPYHSDLAFIHDQQVREKIKVRFQKDNQGIEIDKNLDSVIEYLDFNEIIVTINENKVFFSPIVQEYFKSIFKTLTSIAPIRNRVMHTRPLIGGDFAAVYEFVRTIKSSDPVNWLTTIETRLKIEKDPSYVLTLTIPFFESEPEISAVHNLPVPDFDETGFIGRKKDVEDIKKLILSNKVVSIIGDGGVGKTAVALKVAYDILDLGEKCPFELIIWTSAKTTMLTAKGIEDIHASIKNYGSLIDAISVSMDEKGKLEDTSQKLNEILDYLLVFKTLLIIDNLETIQSEEVRNFIREAQMRCNIVITSRIGLGELEFPRKLSGLTEVESANLIREIARIRNSDTLLKLPQATLVDIASKLYFNPLALKWFVNTVETGISPNEVLSNKNNLLNFCLSNVYEKLSKGALRILDTIRGARKSLNTAEIIYLSGMQPIEVRKHLNELFTTTLISREIVGKSNLEEVSYSITDFSSDYLSKNHILPVNSVKEISAKLRSLTQSVEHISQVTLHNEFSLNALSYRTPNERIAAKFLTEALSFSKNTEFVEALKKIDEAKSIVPNYFETYRVSAFIKATAGDYLGADEDYRTGLEIEPANLRLLFYYSQFLLFQIEDINTAFDYAQKVYLLRPNNSFTAFLIARCLNAHHKYDEAIEIIENLLKGYVNPKDTRIAHTDMIRYLQNKAIHKIRIENDFTGAFDCFKKSIEIFEICFKAKNYDYKVIKGFCDALYLYISSIPFSILSDHFDFAKRLLIEYDPQISISPIKYKILLKFCDKFQVESIDGILLPNEKNTQAANKLTGNIDRTSIAITSPYVFIEASIGRLYANKASFIDINNWTDWKNIANGQLVEFEVGENFEGTCAINIKIR